MWLCSFHYTWCTEMIRTLYQSVYYACKAVSRLLLHPKPKSNRTSKKVFQCLQCFDEGSKIKPVWEEKVIAREEVEAVKQMLKVNDKYFVVYGEKGCGKTVLMQQLTYNRPGVLMFDVPEECRFLGYALGQALNIPMSKKSPDRLIRGLFGETRSLLLRNLHILTEAAALNKKRGHRPLVLVVDNAHLLNAQSVVFLRMYAEMHAAMQDLVMVFVMSEGEALDFLKQEAGGPRIMVKLSDLPEKNAKKFLQLSNGWDHSILDNQFASIYSVTGGNLSLLVQTVKMLQTSATRVKHLQSVLFPLSQIANIYKRNLK